VMTGRTGWLEMERGEVEVHESVRPVRDKDGGSAECGKVWCPFATRPERAETAEGTDLNHGGRAPPEQESERP
jgi:hypothetical protein